MRRELVHSGLTKFSDHPESYWAWKSSFKNATEGLYLTASEELDLLIKWLGSQSSNHVMRIRAVYSTNPTVGLHKAWERLEECYGSPEVIERALLERVDNFPNVSQKDPVKLRELGDLLKELEAAKTQGYLPGLSYLDTARGVNPIVEKLPFGLQEKWLAQGSLYKEQYHVSFPPFAFFTDFVCNEARRRNDPSFVLSTAPRAESLDGTVRVMLPTLIECNHIPDNRSEIPTSDAAQHHTHLKSIAHKIPQLDPEAQILLLLGRDILQVHKVREQRNGPHNAPYAQRLDLGWVIIGDVCLGSAHRPVDVTGFHTSVLENGRPTFLTPCPNHMYIKEQFGTQNQSNSTNFSPLPVTPIFNERNLGKTIFEKTKDDDKIGLSIEDKMFLEYAHHRLVTLLRTFERKPQLKAHFVTYMQKIFDRDQAEMAPPLAEGEECWYLPFFGVYHPRKHEQIRVVFDSSAQHHGISLNSVLLTGPDLNNSLLGVFLRFRREAVAIIADIEQMFHSFVVKEGHRNFLRFLWFDGNDPNKEIVEYRMKVHVFGNSPSPAVAICGLQRAAQHGEAEYGKDTKHFVERNFYMDDGLLSLPSATGAIDLLKRTQEMLAVSNLRLHKIASNCPSVLEAFPLEDHAKGLQDLNFDDGATFIQRSLGLCWDLKYDIFTFNVADTERPFTRRGVLATVNSLFDPLGLIAPVTIQGKCLLRDLMSCKTLDWDSALPEEREVEWRMWKDSLQHLKEFKTPRPYAPTSFSTAQRKELHIFSDASVKAIAAVAYIKVIDSVGKYYVGFVFGKAKLAPPAAHTIPRLELGAAVLAVEVACLIQNELDITLDDLQFYTDSKVVLGYIHNQTRRFHVYVCHRVQYIRRFSKPEQWHYICTTQNPADHATRSVPAAQLTSTTWLTGPHFLSIAAGQPITEEETYDLIEPNLDPEVRSHATTLTVPSSTLGSYRFERFSSWKSLVQAIAFLKHVVKSKITVKKDKTCCGWHVCTQPYTAEELLEAETLIIRCVQQETYREEFSCIAARKDIPKGSSLRKLNPCVDEDGLLRIGGRLKHGRLEAREKYPLVIPGQSHVATLLVRHFHDKVRHQGRAFTEGAVRTAGFWIVGAKNCIKRILHSCVTCLKLRGRAVEQKMADLPADRLSMEPPFTYVGLDVFGPWTVITRRTRGGQANNK
ncbi:hypothetical protein NFI96_026210, partial [Prochilodus magdalenae]